MTIDAIEFAEEAEPAELVATKAVEPRRGRLGGELAVQIALLSIGIIVAIPVVVAIFTSFTPLPDILADPNSIWSGDWTFENYDTAWNATPFGRFMVNSFVQTGIITAAQVGLSVLAAYAFAMFEFRGRNLLFGLVLGSLMVPFELTFIPNFVLISNLGWANTYQGLTIPFLASAFGVFMLRQFFMSIPRDLYDAARIDGMSDWGYLWKVMVPLSRGAIAALTIFSFLGAWNQYLWPLVITNDESMRTAQIGIRFFLANQERATDWGAIMAGATIVMVPTLLVFIVAQRQLVRGIAMSGLKG
jgi:ABC-type glycerol-3-phosphate transport system permease component